MSVTQSNGNDAAAGKRTRLKVNIPINIIKKMRIAWSLGHSGYKERTMCLSGVCKEIAYIL